jgi:hypothetical protein
MRGEDPLPRPADRTNTTDSNTAGYRYLCHDVWVESRGAHEAGTQAN